ncbi:uncharacterized protein LOC111890454 [Lactuca sativa]|uniref:non-specific serine/threonine protein kinase n=1 Tax=Lactuca sativa TaxID=4236 RepID=A0A9R1XBX5_LACSA|nr:uncharacterized protein LOC111890454 [Lactuca sativa]KAJ0206679.1 hypothetical protein LSAT_V11C500249770 [Lactuca sativa]
MEAFLKEIQHLKIQLEDIKSATNKFDNNKIIGRGGFGKVYKGVISHSKGQSMVAFKRLDSSYGQGHPEFLKEILMLSRCTHENVISLMGFCNEDDEKIIVYEYASHGSLDHHLSNTDLTWMQRLKICIAAAKGLCYLHDPNGSEQRVIHRDIKSSNILLDENWNAKVSDMGLSKIGPANQSHSFLPTNVVGTFGYIDPLYMETYSLTKESDVYSFGLVLFEVLCGRPCIEHKNGHFHSLVPMWKKRYEETKLDEIIFEEVKQHMDPRSLKPFSDIAYQCLRISREERPKMSRVVEKLEIALEFQEISEEVELPIDYEEMSKAAVPPLVYRSKEELMMLLYKGIMVNEGKTWFSLNKNGEHCEMISAAECLIPLYCIPRQKNTFPPKKSRLIVNDNIPLCWKFKTHVRTQFLSPHIMYTIHLVFNLEYRSSDYLGLGYILAGETKSSTSYFADKREDGLLMAELYHFTSDKRNVDLEITFECQNPLIVEGIEFQPMERVEKHEVLEDKEVDLQTISHSETYWEQKLPNDWEEMIKWSKDSLQWTTKKELYSILCKGFLINNGEEWFSLAKYGKKCHMLSARIMALRKSEWKWRSLPESRFEEVAFDPHGSFRIKCSSNILSPETTYASYLVYKLQENYYGFESPLKVIDCVKVSDGVFFQPFERQNHSEEDLSWYIYLHSPQTPIIRRKVYQDNHDLVNRPKKKRIPQQRNDGWMEENVWEFQTGTTTESISKNLRLMTIYDATRSLKGLIVQGIEFRPI